MALLDGDIAALFGEVFSGLYLEGTLHAGLTAPTYDNEGNITGFSGSDATQISVQTDAATFAMRQEQGFVEGDASLIILAQSAPIVTSDHEVTDGYGKRWKIMTASQDAARSHWLCRARPA